MVPYIRMSGPDSTEPRWVLAVVGHDDGSTPVLAVQPRSADQYDQVATRLRRGGWKRLSAGEWSRRAWPVAPAGAVDVVGGELVRFTTGTASVYCADDVPTTPMWASAARERRALVALVPPGAFDAAEARAEAGGSPDIAGTVFAEAAAGRQLYAALATVRFDVFTGPRPGR